MPFHMIINLLKEHSSLGFSVRDVRFGLYSNVASFAAVAGF